MYFISFFSTLGVVLLFALYLPVKEKIYKKAYCFSMVMEMQLVMEIATTALATIGITFDDSFLDMRRETTVIANIASWKLCFMCKPILRYIFNSTTGIVFLTSSLIRGICMAARLAMNLIRGVLVYDRLIL
ncbi:hypothetical protein K2173_022969 [Erythroxylum novogranatense]|uniref:Uncharacterized protein n=1 Tax=Erythroxylum novogranatense TaxID=1862640 RepID=A0AAV8T9F6_9ROSI|nr:hypothetical protein K2173_022969 [Erythroxylum novogranatense]